jgi:hypothetical protein
MTKSNFWKVVCNNNIVDRNTHDDEPWTLECNIRHTNSFKSVNTRAYYHSMSSPFAGTLSTAADTFVYMRTQRGGPSQRKGAKNRSFDTSIRHLWDMIIK